MVIVDKQQLIRCRAIFASNFEEESAQREERDHWVYSLALTVCNLLTIWTESAGILEKSAVYAQYGPRLARHHPSCHGSQWSFWRLWVIVAAVVAARKAAEEVPLLAD